MAKSTKTGRTATSSYILILVALRRIHLLTEDENERTESIVDCGFIRSREMCIKVNLSRPKPNILHKFLATIARIVIL